MTAARRLRWPLALALFGFLTAATAADAPRPADPKAFDKLIVDTLRDVHNKGADLYNAAKDYPGTFRLYEGSLRTVRPLLSYRPAAQKLVDDGLDASDREADPARRAFLLHETIEKVRANLKNAPAAPPLDTELKKEPTPAPVPMPKKDPTPVPMPKKEPTPAPVDPKPVPMPMVPPKKEPAPKPVPMPMPKTPEPKPADPMTVKPTTPKTPAKTEFGGVVTLAGKPLAKADVLLVSLALPKPRVFSATTTDDGKYAMTETVPPGPYVVVIAGKDVPAKYGTTTTSGLKIDVKTAGTFNFDLK